MAITIRVTEEQEKTIEILKRSVREKSSSKALLEAAKLVPNLKNQLWENEQEIESLKNELNQFKFLINEIHESKESLLALANR